MAIEVDIPGEDAVMKTNTRFISGMFILCAAPVLLFAAEPESTGETKQVLEEIIVTAQKRQQNLQNVAASVAVVSGEQLLENHIDGVDDLQKVVPSMAFTDGNNSDAASLSIRGIGSR